MTTDTKQIMEKLDIIKSELDYIKENMVPADAILTEEDKLALNQANRELENGETISLEDLKKELSE